MVSFQAYGCTWTTSAYVPSSPGRGPSYADGGLPPEGAECVVEFENVDDVDQAVNAAGLEAEPRTLSDGQLGQLLLERYVERLTEMAVAAEEDDDEPDY